MSFAFTPYKLSGLLLVEGKSFPDERGFFIESFRVKDMEGQPIPPLIQDNVSRSRKGVIRGLHFQKNPSPLGKLIRCLRGKIYDVAVDIRRSSPTYGQWAAVELDDQSNRMFWVPAGFAHGFQALSDTADVLYKQTGYWSPPDDCGMLWNDPAVGVKWPIKDAVLSAKDAQLPLLADTANNFT